MSNGRRSGNICHKSMLTKVSVGASHWRSEKSIAPHSAGWERRNEIFIDRRKDCSAVATFGSSRLSLVQ